MTDKFWHLAVATFYPETVERLVAVGPQGMIFGPLNGTKTGRMKGPETCSMCLAGVKELIPDTQASKFG